MHGCIIITVAIDVLLLKHQAITIHSVGLVFIFNAQGPQKYYIYCKQHKKLNVQFEKKNTHVLKS